jgi:hypothetical protein
MSGVFRSIFGGGDDYHMPSIPSAPSYEELRFNAEQNTRKAFLSQLIERIFGRRSPIQSARGLINIYNSDNFRPVKQLKRPHE